MNPTTIQMRPPDRLMRYASLLTRLVTSRLALRIVTGASVISSLAVLGTRFGITGLRELQLGVDVSANYLIATLILGSLFLSIRALDGDSAAQSRARLVADTPWMFVAFVLAGASFYAGILTDGFWLRAGSLGNVPWNDASGHFSGSLEFLNEGIINDWVGRRPLSIISNATLILLAGKTFLFYPFVSYLFMLAAAFCLVWRLAFVVSPVFAPWFLVLSSSYLVNFSWPFLSANSGFALACLAAVLLLEAAVKRSVVILIVGSALLSLAIYVRPGPLFVLPFLGLCGFFLLKRGRNWLIWLLFGIISCNIGILFSLGLLWFFGTSTVNVFNENMYESFYGFVRFGDWTTASRELQNYYSLSIAERRALILEMIKQSVLNEPHLILKQLNHNFEIVKNYFITFWQLQCFNREMTANRMFCSRSSDLALFALPICVGILAVRAAQRDRVATLLMFIFAGGLLSTLVLYRDGGQRAFAVLWPFMSLVYVYAMWVAVVLWGRAVVAASCRFGNSTGLQPDEWVSAPTPPALAKTAGPFGMSPLSWVVVSAVSLWFVIPLAHAVLDIPRRYVLTRDLPPVPEVLAETCKGRARVVAGPNIVHQLRFVPEAEHDPWNGNVALRHGRTNADYRARAEGIFDGPLTSVHVMNLSGQGRHVRYSTTHYVFDGEVLQLDPASNHVVCDEGVFSELWALRRGRYLGQM